MCAWDIKDRRWQQTANISHLITFSCVVRHWHREPFTTQLLIILVLMQVNAIYKSYMNICVNLNDGCSLNLITKTIPPQTVKKTTSLIWHKLPTLYPWGSSWIDECLLEWPKTHQWHMSNIWLCKWPCPCPAPRLGRESTIQSIYHNFGVSVHDLTTQELTWS